MYLDELSTHHFHNLWKIAKTNLYTLKLIWQQLDLSYIYKL